MVGSALGAAASEASVEGDGELMVSRNHQRHRTRQIQEPCQIVGLAPELLTNSSNLGRLARRLKRSDQAAQLRSQLDSAERFILGKACEIAKQLAEAAQSTRP